MDPVVVVVVEEDVAEIIAIGDRFPHFPEDRPGRPIMPLHFDALHLPDPTLVAEQSFARPDP
jgi:hypothetical protein